MADEKNQARGVNSNWLRQMGYPNAIIKSAENRQKAGMLKYEPPANLVGAIAACAHRLPEPVRPEPEPFPSIEPVLQNLFGKAQGAVEAAFGTVLGGHSLAHPDPSLVRPEILVAHSHGLARHYADALNYSIETKRRPLLIVDNHNLIDPAWWQSDPDFTTLRAACHAVNREVICRQIDPTARVVVLRPDLGAYDLAALDVFSTFLRDSLSDVFFLPLARAGAYADRDVAVIGDRRLLLMHGPASTPWEVFGSARVVEDPALASRIRNDFQDVMDAAIAVKIRGRMMDTFSIGDLTSPEGIKNLISRVIQSPASAAPQTAAAYLKSP